MCLNFVGKKQTRCGPFCQNVHVWTADGPTKRCPVATLVHKFGWFFNLRGYRFMRGYFRLFTLVSCYLCGIGFVWLHIKQNNHKMTNCTKNHP